MDATIAFEDRQFTVAEARDYLKISESFFFKLVRNGKLKTQKLGTRTLISGAELKRVLADTAA